MTRPCAGNERVSKSTQCHETYHLEGRNECAGEGKRSIVGCSALAGLLMSSNIPDEQPERSQSGSCYPRDGCQASLS